MQVRTAELVELAILITAAVVTGASPVLASGPVVGSPPGRGGRDDAVRISTSVKVRFEDAADFLAIVSSWFCRLRTKKV
jgi:hypothetical protein